MATLSLVPGVIMMLTFFMLHLLLIDQILSSRSDKALTYQTKISKFKLELFILCLEKGCLNRVLVVVSLLSIIGFIAVNVNFISNIVFSDGP